MKLSASMIRGPVDELSALTPEEWDLRDVSGAFRFEVTVRPETQKWADHIRQEAKKATEAAIAIQTGNEKSAAKLVKKRLDKTPQRRKSEKQAEYTLIREQLLVSLTEVFSDGRREPVEETDLEDLFTAPESGAACAWCDAASAGLEDELNDEAYSILEKKGESLADAVCRFIVRLSDDAARQRTQIDEEEVLGPLQSTSDSGPGNEPREMLTPFTRPSDDSSSDDAAQTAAKAG